MEMIVGGAPHALSLLYSLCPPQGRVERLRVQANDARDGVATALTVSFQYSHSLGRTSMSIDLCHMPQSPRPAGYTIDGRSVFVARDAIGRGGDNPLRMPIGDPLKLLLAEFQKRVTAADQGIGAASQADATLLERLGLLRTIEAVARTALAG
jgi:hypothetical protein